MAVCQSRNIFLSGADVTGAESAENASKPTAGIQISQCRPGEGIQGKKN